MSRSTLKKSNSAILPAKNDFFVSNAGPITNSRSMTQIDSLEDGCKIDNIQPIKKWSYLDNFKKTSPSLPSRAININIDESSSDKVNFHVHKSKSASVAQADTPFLFKRIAVKQNSADTLSNKLSENIKTKRDYLTPYAGRITNSLSMTHIDSFKDSINNDKIQLVEKWSYLHSFNKNSLRLTEPHCNINMNESLSDDSNSSRYKPESASTAKGQVNPPEMKFQTLPAIPKTCGFQDVVSTKSKSRITQNFMHENKEQEKTLEVPFVNSDDNSKNQSLKKSERVLFTSENSEENKLVEHANDDKICEDENFSDDIWKSYFERPLLPLKPLQKQKSLSCSNLVQTIKGLSKRKASANNRFSSPENTLFENKELRTHETNVSKLSPRKTSVDSADQNFRRLSDVSVTIKEEHQNLQHHPWYHLVDSKEASKRLSRMRRSGAFLIRPASNPTSEVFHTLCVACSGRIYNFHITNLRDGHITLSKLNEQRETFSSLLNMIKYYQTVPLTINLTDQVMRVHLLITPPK